VDILHVNSNRKNAADDKLKDLMRRFADLHGTESSIILISGQSYSNQLPKPAHMN
jgi:hypothetical protein